MWASQKQLAGHMRSLGLVFETPALRHACQIHITLQDAQKNSNLLKIAIIIRICGMNETLGLCDFYAKKTDHFWQFGNNSASYYSFLDMV